MFIRHKNINGGCVERKDSSSTFFLRIIIYLNIKLTKHPLNNKTVNFALEWWGNWNVDNGHK